MRKKNPDSTVEKITTRAFENESLFENTFLHYVDLTEKTGKMPNIAGFCYYARIDRSTFYAMADMYPHTYRLIQECLEDKTINANIGDSFRSFYLKNKFGYRDKVETENINYDAKTYEEFIARTQGDEY